MIQAPLTSLPLPSFPFSLASPLPQTATHDPTGTSQPAPRPQHSSSPRTHPRNLIHTDNMMAYHESRPAPAAPGHSHFHSPYSCGHAMLPNPLMTSHNVNVNVNVNINLNLNYQLHSHPHPHHQSYSHSPQFANVNLNHNQSSSPSSSKTPWMSTSTPTTSFAPPSTTPSGCFTKRPKPSLAKKPTSSTGHKRNIVQSSLEAKVEKAKGFHAFFVPLARSLPPAPPCSPVLAATATLPTGSGQSSIPAMSLGKTVIDGASFSHIEGFGAGKPKDNGISGWKGKAKAKGTGQIGGDHLGQWEAERDSKGEEWVEDVEAMDLDS